ncbi:isoleucine--tRNA ligase, cytoplasmic [Tanacetum coccineum]
MEAVKKHVGIPIDEASKGLGGMAHFVSKFAEPADPEYASPVVKGETPVILGRTTGSYSGQCVVKRYEKQGGNCLMKAGVVMVTVPAKGTPWFEIPPNIEKVIRDISTVAEKKNISRLQHDTKSEVIEDWIVSYFKVAVPSWFIAVEKLKDQTTWIPDFVKEKRDGVDIIVIGSVEELERRSGEKVTDLHRDKIDHITIPSPHGQEEFGVLHRVEDDVFDCWFESGSIPYAYIHYPFENKEFFNDNFPRDFIAEGLDQTRGWFYTLMVLTILLLIDAYGADALRLCIINSPVVRAEPLRSKEKRVYGVIKDVLLPWYNASRFLVQNANRLATFDPLDPAILLNSANVLDHWIILATQSLVYFVRQEMDAYRLYTVVPYLLKLIDNLTNIYVRFNRKRLKGRTGEEHCRTALSTLYHEAYIKEALGCSLLDCSLNTSCSVVIAEETYKNILNHDFKITLSR